MATNLTMTQFKADLADFENAIQVVSAQAGVIDQNCQDLTAAMQGVPQTWMSPAGQTFAELVPPCTKQMHALNDLLAQMVRRMRAAHETYLNMEQTNTRNLQ
jgi:WXG100 family type VII secretion target